MQLIGKPPLVASMCRLNEATWYARAKKLVALPLLVMCVTGCESIGEFASAVDTGLYEITEAATEVDAVTGERSLNLVTGQSEAKRAEATLGRIVANPTTIGARPDARQVPPSDPRYIRLERIFNRVVSASHAADEMNRSVAFVYFDDPLKNAFALGGNKMVFFTGFTEDVDDDELAAVIGHEMAHNVASHISEAVASKLILSLASDSADRAGWDQAYTLKHEQEADELGILYATLAGYDPYAASRFWSRQNNAGYLTFRTHPTGPERAQRTRDIADRVAQYGVRGQRNSEAETLLACNVLYCRRKDLSLEPGKGGGLLSMIDAIVVAHVKKLETKSEITRQEAEIAAESTRASEADDYQGQHRNGLLARPSDYLAFRTPGRREFIVGDFTEVAITGKNGRATSGGGISVHVRRGSFQGRDLPIGRDGRFISSSVTPGETLYVITEGNVRSAYAILQFNLARPSDYLAFRTPGRREFIVGDFTEVAITGKNGRATSGGGISVHVRRGSFQGRDLPIGRDGRFISSSVTPGETLYVITEGNVRSAYAILQFN